MIPMTALGLSVSAERSCVQRFLALPLVFSFMLYWFGQTSNSTQDYGEQICERLLFTVAPMEEKKGDAAFRAATCCTP